MTLSLTSSQINKLKLRYDDIIWVSDVLLADDKTQNAVTPRGRIVYPVGCHHFVFEAFPEVLETIFAGVALELVDIFDEYIVVRCHFYFEARNSFQRFRCDLVLI